MFFLYILFTHLVAHIVCAQTVTDAPTASPSASLSPTTILSPTPTPITNISFNEVSAFSIPEWLEIYNGNTVSVTLAGWKVKDTVGNTKDIPTTTIQPNVLFSFQFTGNTILNNTVSETEPEIIYLIDPQGRQIDSFKFTTLKEDASYSWSYTPSGWCQKVSTPNADNGLCPVPTSTNTPTPSHSPTPTKTPTPTPTSAPSTSTAVPTQTKSPTLKPTSTPSQEPSPTDEEPLLEEGEVLAATDMPTLNPEPSIETVVTPSVTSNKTNNFSPSPVLFLVAGGLLLLSPLIVTALQKR